MWISIARRIGVCVWLAVLGATAWAQPEAMPQGREIAIAEALARTVAQNPELKVSGFQRDMLAGELQQANLPPNPELGIAVQDVLGTDRFSGFDNAETTVTLSWLLERGVRERLIGSARAGVDLGAADADVARLDAAAETARRFLACLAYQARLERAAAAVRLAAETVAAIGDRVAAGRAPEAELARAEAELARAELVEEDYEHELLSAYHRLGAQWGSTDPDFASVAGDLDSLPVLEPYERLAARVEQNPDLERYMSQRRLHEAELALARAQSRPAWRLSGGLRRAEGSDDLMLVGGITIPLAVRDKNEGRIAAASASVARTAAERDAARVRIETALFVLYQELNHNLQLAGRMREDILPRLEAALADTRRAYELGRYGYLEWRAVQGELLDAQERRLEAGIAAHGLVIEIERLTGVAIAPPAATQ
jgi:cobalt-zinc-cadmium efflux system outer membrane protein